MFLISIYLTAQVPPKEERCPENGRPKILPHCSLGNMTQWRLKSKMTAQKTLLWMKDGSPRTTAGSGHASKWLLDIEFAVRTIWNQMRLMKVFLKMDFRREARGVEENRQIAIAQSLPAILRISLWKRKEPGKDQNILWWETRQLLWSPISARNVIEFLKEVEAWQITSALTVRRPRNNVPRHDINVKCAQKFFLKGGSWRFTCDSTPEKNHSSVTCATRRFLKGQRWKDIARFTSQRSGTSATCATGRLLRVPAWKDTARRTQNTSLSRSGSSVIHAAPRLPTTQTCSDTAEFTRVKNRTNVTCVTNAIAGQATWGCISVHTPEKHLFSAKSAERLSPSIAFCGDTCEYTPGNRRSFATFAERP